MDDKMLYAAELKQKLIGYTGLRNLANHQDQPETVEKFNDIIANLTEELKLVDNNLKV